MSNPIVYGIDIGTSSCKLSVYDGESCRLLDVADGFNNYWGNSCLLLSAAYLDGEGHDDLLIGQEAYNRHLPHPEWYVDEFKRRFSSTAPILHDEKTGYNVTIDQIYIQTLQILHGIIQKREGDANLVVLTHPAAYSPKDVERLVQYANSAGFFDVKTLDEPFAAAQYYAYKNKNVGIGENVLVYDFGGGTFDTALIRMEKDGFRHLADSRGCNECGGANIDDLIEEDILRKLSQTPDGQVALQSRQVRSLMKEKAVAVKHRLSKNETVQEVIPVGFNFFPYTLTRAELDGMIEPLLQKTLDTCDDLVLSGGLTSKQINRVILVGGSSSIPQVERALRAKFPVANIGRSDFPEQMVCLGAAVSGNVSAWDVLIRRSLLGDLEASFQLAERYISGDTPEHEEDIPAAMEQLLKAGEGGHVTAQYTLGLIYRNGIEGHVSPDAETSFRWFMKAAEQNHPGAQDEVGDYYQRNNESDKALEWHKKAGSAGNPYAQLSVGKHYLDAGDLETAFLWMKRSAEQDNPDALYYVGRFYEVGAGGVSADLTKAYEFYRKAAEQGDPDGQFKVGYFFYVGIGPVEENNDEAFAWGVKAAERGHPGAQAMIAECYQKGFGVGVNLNKAFEFYLKSAQQGNATSQAEVAAWYYYGRGPVKEDNAEAFAWGMKAAEQGNPSAQFLVGECFAYGYGTQKNLKKSFDWYLKAAEQGHVAAQANLADIYCSGNSAVQKNYAQGFQWAKKAAEQGNASAQFRLGVCYDNGYGVAKSESTAFQWYLKAANQELSVAEYNVGIDYLRGEGVQKNVTEAEKWLRRSIKHGYDGAIETLNQLKHLQNLPLPVIKFRRNHTGFYGSGRNIGVRIDHERQRDLKDGVSFDVTVSEGEHYLEVAWGNFWGSGVDNWSTDNCIIDHHLNFDLGDVFVVDLNYKNPKIYWEQLQGVMQSLP